MLKEKEAFKKIFFFRILIAVLIGLTIFLAVSAGRALWRKRQIDGEIADLKKEMAEIGENNKYLSVRLDYLKGRENLEKEARLQLNMKKPGEKVVVIVKNEVTSSPTEVETGDAAGASSGRQISNPEKWWHYFFR